MRKRSYLGQHLSVALHNYLFMHIELGKIVIRKRFEGTTACVRYPGKEKSNKYKHIFMSDPYILYRTH